MGMPAVGTYLRTLRETRGLSRTEVAALIGTNESQIVRIETGEIDTRGSLLLAFVSAVRGKAEHVQRLITDPAATSDEAKVLAHDVVSSSSGSASDQQHEASPEPQRKPRIDHLVSELEALPADDLVDVLIRLQTKRR